jgi:hypothetical protein
MGHCQAFAGTFIVHLRRDSWFNRRLAKRISAAEKPCQPLFPKSLAPAIDKRIITVHLVANGGLGMACLQQQDQPRPACVIGTPAAARRSNSKRSASVSTIVFSMIHIMLPFQWLPSTRAGSLG